MRVIIRIVERDRAYALEHRDWWRGLALISVIGIVVALVLLLAIAALTHLDNRMNRLIKTEGVVPARMDGR